MAVRQGSTFRAPQPLSPPAPGAPRALSTSSPPGSVPLDPQLTQSLEEGRDFIQEFPHSPAFPALCAIAQKILDETPALRS